MINGFTLHDTSSAPTASADILNGVQKAWGFVPNLHRVLAESPAALDAYTTLWGIAEKTSFTPQERNLVYLAIILGPIVELPMLLLIARIMLGLKDRIEAAPAVGPDAR